MVNNNTALLEQVFAASESHVERHRCGAKPYEHMTALITKVQQNATVQPKKILEIGTALGYSAICFANAFPAAHITTLEKNVQHVELAKQQVADQQLTEHIHIVPAIAETDLSLLPANYDLIFFDGFQVHAEFFEEFQRLLVPTGLLIIANTHLDSKTSEQFWQWLFESNGWRKITTLPDTEIWQKTSSN